RRTAARSEVPAAGAAAPRPDAGGRVESDLGRLADGFLKMVESERARVAGVLGDEVVSVMTMARYLIEDALQRLAPAEPAQATEALLDARKRIHDATHTLQVLCSEL